MRQINYCKCAVVCHGLSELTIAKYIKSNLHLKLEILSRDDGHSSIQITSLLDFLNKSNIKNLKKISDEYGIEYKKGKLLNFKMFVIMDTDDCSEEEKNSFLDKTMFKNHPLYDYICPINNSPNLEEVLRKAGIITRKIKDNEKGEFYIKTFPINSDPLNLNSINEIETLRNKLVPINDTKMDEFIAYALSLVKKI